MYRTKKGRKAIIFYASNLRIFELFPEEMQEKMALWVMEYGFTGKMTDCPDDMMLILKPILGGIRTQSNRYKNIEVLSWAIDQIQRESMDISDPNAVKMMEKAQTMLKKWIIQCKKQDVGNWDVRTQIYKLFYETQVQKYVKKTPERINMLFTKEEQEYLQKNGSLGVQPVSSVPPYYAQRVG